MWVWDFSGCRSGDCRTFVAVPKNLGFAILRALVSSLPAARQRLVSTIIGGDVSRLDGPVEQNWDPAEQDSCQVPLRLPAENVGCLHPAKLWLVDPVIGDPFASAFHSAIFSNSIDFVHRMMRHITLIATQQTNLSF
jgi:hypothetical protein